MESQSCIIVPLNRIRSTRFSFRGSLEDPLLRQSLRTHGLVQPLTVLVNGKQFDLISGHKRLHELKKLKQKTALVYCVEKMDSKKLFLSALLLNHPASYFDIDRCGVIQRAGNEFKFSQTDLQNIILPLLGLSPSLKVLNQYQRVARLPAAIQKMISSEFLPFQGSFWLEKLTRTDLDFFRRRVLVKIRPTASQLAHLGEWMIDLIQLRQKPLRIVLKEIKLSFLSGRQDMRRKTDLFYLAVRELRFPDLSAKEKAFNGAAMEIRGKVQGLDIRAPEHFEQEGFHLRAHIRNSKVLAEVIGQLQSAQNHASALFDTLL